MNKQEKKILNYPLLAIQEKNGSERCIIAIGHIADHRNEELLKLIDSPLFNINERFDTSYTQRENYLGYALWHKNYEAVQMVLDAKIVLYDNEKQELLDKLTMERKYLTLYKIFKSLNPYFNINDFIKGCITTDISDVYKIKR